MMTDAAFADAWDPLEAAAKSSDQDIITASKKREIKNILKSYVGTYDPMSELIQNAMDAVEKRLHSSEDSYKPHLTIKIDLSENSFQVVDNGCGFGRSQFRAFLAPNISFKNDPKSRGNKGVGATYIAYGFNHLEIQTKSSDYQFMGQFRQGREWVDDNSGVVHRPRIEISTTEDPILASLDQGTSVKLIFGGKNTRPSNLAWYQAATPEQWKYLLLLKTPLGHLSLPDGGPSGLIGTEESCW